MLNHLTRLRRTVAGRSPGDYLARLLVVTIALTMLVATQAASVRFADGAAAATSGTSSDGRLTVTDSTSVATVPYGGGQVTYTFTVGNNSGQDLYFRGLTDSACSPISPSSGLQTNIFGSYIPAGLNATFTCTTTVTQTTTDTVTAQFGDLWGTFTSTATATATVTLTQNSSNSCDTLWYSSDVNPSYASSTTGNIGTLTTSGTPTASPKYTIQMSDNGAIMNGAAAVAVNPANPNQIYFIPRRLDTDFWGNPTEKDGGLWVYDTTTGTAKEVVTPANNQMTVRLGFAPDGTLWTVTDTGVLYSYTPGATTWTNRGQITLPSGSPSWSVLHSGDLAFDGLGNMWLILSDDGLSGTTTARLYTITAAQLAGTDGATAQYVGPMGNTRFNGLAFGPDGTLYATSTQYETAGNYNGTYYANDWTLTQLYTVNMTNGTSTSLGQINIGSNLGMGDLSSCSLPKPQLRVSKTVTPGPSVATGTQMTYTITTENIGTLAATGATLQDALPTGTTYVAGSAKLNGTQINTSSTFPYATTTEIHSAGALSGVIAAGQKATLTFTVTVSATSGQVCNQGSVAITGTNVVVTDDPALGGSTDKTCINIAVPGIAVDKTANYSTLAGSGPVTYTYTVTNTGTEPLKTVTLSDDKCPNPVLQAANYSAGTGDINGDGILQTTEKWVYTCTQTISTTTTNIATASGVGTQTGKTVTGTDTWTVTVNPAAINVVKQAGTVTGPNSAGQYTATYTVTVTNTGNGSGSYGPLTDTPNFDSKTTSIVSASWSGAVTGSATGSGPYTLLSSSRTLAAGASDTYNVSIVFTHPNLSGATSACAGPGTGLYNSVSATGETGSTSDNNACDVPPTYAGLTGKVYYDANDNGSFTSPGDTPVQGATMTLLDSTGKVVGTTTTAADGTYQFMSLTPGTYTVTYTAPNGDIVTQAYQVVNPAGVPTTNGTATSGNVGVTAGNITTGVDFGIYLPTHAIHVAKFARGGTALAGAQFALYDVNPGTAGATPISNGITADASGVTFTSTGLSLNKTYWLVETKSPSGYDLLPDPIAFTVTSSGVTLQGATPGVAVSSTDTFTLNVTDAGQLALPKAGGLGASTLPVGGLALVLTVLALAYWERNRRTRLISRRQA